MSTFDELHGEYLAGGWRDVKQHGQLAAGTRVYHRGHQWPGAAQGTGTVRAVMLRDPSPWSAVYGVPDVEVIVEYDADKAMRSAGECAGVANYHLRVAESAGTG